MPFLRACVCMCVSIKANWHCSKVSGVVMFGTVNVAFTNNTNA